MHTRSENTPTLVRMNENRRAMRLCSLELLQRSVLVKQSITVVISLFTVMQNLPSFLSCWLLTDMHSDSIPGAVRIHWQLMLNMKFKAIRKINPAFSNPTVFTIGRQAFWMSSCTTSLCKHTTCRQFFIPFGIKVLDYLFSTFFFLCIDKEQINTAVRPNSSLKPKTNYFV